MFIIYEHPCTWRTPKRDSHLEHNASNGSLFFPGKYLSFAYIAAQLLGYILPAQGVHLYTVIDGPGGGYACGFSHAHAGVLDAEGGLGGEAAAGTVACYHEIGKLEYFLLCYCSSAFRQSTIPFGRRPDSFLQRPIIHQLCSFIKQYPQDFVKRFLVLRYYFSDRHNCDLRRLLYRIRIHARGN